jgi:hypothetical protein
MLKTYLVTHSHRFGTDLHKFATEREALQNCAASYSEGCEIDDDLKCILDALEINFEPERDEYLDIELDDMVAVYIP